MATTTVIEHLLEQVEKVAPIIRAHATEAEQQRHLSQVVSDAMYEAGLFAMMAPKAYGGLELHPVETMQVLEAVARIDAAAAWNLSMAQGIASYAAWLSVEGVAELFRDGIPTVAGALHPPARATRADGGWRLTGQCPFGGGCHNAKWLAMPAAEFDGDAPKVDPSTGQPAVFGAFFPRSKANILDEWHTLGMRGTGSTDFAVTDLFVPDYMTVPVGPLMKPSPGFEGPTYRMWPLTAIFGEATVSVGVAAAALADALELCKTKTPAYNAIPSREQQLVQHQLGRASARIAASRDTLYRAAEEGYEDAARSGSTLSVESKVRMQLAACFAADACAEAVRIVNDAVGTSSIHKS